MAGPLVYTVTEAAAELKLSRKLVYRLIDQGELPAIRMGERRLLVPRRALEEFVNDRAAGSAS